MPKNFSPRHLPALALLLCLSACTVAGARAQGTPPAEAAGAASQSSLPELIRRVKPAVVAIITYDAKGNTLLSGSGFFLRPGQVVTNLHVVEGARRAEVKTLDGKGRVYAVDGLLALDEEGDLAILSVAVAAERSRAAEVAQGLPEEGERIFVIGNPLRLEGSVSDGIVSAMREVPSLGRIIQITAPISHGNSGSPAGVLRFFIDCARFRANGGYFYVSFCFE